jgi:hypothetical protein
MKKIIIIALIGMLILIGTGNILSAGSEERDFANRAPKAPIFIYEKCSLKKDCYSYCLFSEDPDNDKIYFEISWDKIDHTDFIACSSDDPVVQLFGPYESGEEFGKDYNLPSSGTYELSVRARDVFDNIGPTSTLTITYKESKILHTPIAMFLRNFFPEIFDILSEIF